MVITAVQLMHPDAERWLGKGGLRKSAVALLKESDFAGDTATWLRSISKYLAAVRSESTKARWPEGAEARLFAYPADWKFTGDSVRDANGAEVEAIDGWPIGRLQRSISPWVSVEGRSDDARDAAFSWSLPQFEPILIGLKSARTVTIGGKESKLERAKVAAPSVVLERLPGQILHLEIRRLETDRGELRKALDQIQRDPNLRLILDLRNCHGDDLSMALTMLKALSLKQTPFADRVSARGRGIPATLGSFAQFDREFFGSSRFRTANDGRLELKPEAAPEFLAPLPSDKPFLGDVDVLVGPGTGAVAAYLTGRLTAARPTRTIGRIAAGYAAGFSGGRFLNLTLPESGIRIQVPLLRFEVLAAPKDRFCPGQMVNGDALRWAVEHPPSVPRRG